MSLRLVPVPPPVPPVTLDTLRARADRLDAALEADRVAWDALLAALDAMAEDVA